MSRCAALGTKTVGFRAFLRPATLRVLAAANLFAIANLSQPASGGDMVFTDVTQQAGVDYLHWDGVLPNNPGGLSYYHMVGAVAAGDYDNDGWTDLYVTRVRAPNLLFRNRGDGTFEEVGQAAGVDLSGRCSGAGFADVNNDGWLDLYVMTFRRLDHNYLFINNGDGTFTEQAALRGVDMSDTEERLPSSVAFGDVDLDGQLDMIVWTWSIDNPSNTLFHNDAAGYFANVTEAAQLFEPICDTSPCGYRNDIYGWSGAIADIDNDGWPDIVHAGDFGSSRYYRNAHDGSFEDMTDYATVGTDENGMGNTLGDIDNDGDLDWFVTSIYDPNDDSGRWGTTGNRLYRNEGDSLFTDITDAAGVRNGQWGWGTTLADIDNDGDLDLLMTNGIDFPFLPDEDHFHNDPVHLWANDGTGMMTEISTQVGFTDTRSGKGLIVFDYDRDGDLDVFIVNNAEHPVLYRNDGANARDWLQVRLHGTLTNTMGIGARVYVQATPDSPVQMREILGASNFMSHNENIAHFGFDRDLTNIASLRVVWPVSGVVLAYHDVAPNQRLLISEPCPGDTNGDLHIAVDDLQTMLVNFGRGDATGLPDGDVNGDGMVDITDLGLLLRNFGATCHP